MRKEWQNFHSEWLKLYPWLEYSVLEKSCLVDFFLLLLLDRRFLNQDLKIEKELWKKNSGMHDKSFSHKVCMTKRKGFKITEKTDKFVLALINKENETLIIENRYYMATVAEILLSTAFQNIVQRGDNGSGESINKGNFLELLNVCAKRDKR